MLQPQPPGFIDHYYSFSVNLPCSEDIAWQWLNDPRTFTEHQIWPFRVEFYSSDPENIPNGFHEKVITNHHGPFISFAGELIKIEENYRDLQYFYGSYAISFRLIRPYRLEFWTKSTDQGTELTCKLSSYVKPSFSGFWSASQKLFWSSFKRWSRKSTKKLQRSVPGAS